MTMSEAIDVELVAEQMVAGTIRRSGVPLIRDRGVIIRSSRFIGQWQCSELSSPDTGSGTGLSREETGKHDTTCLRDLLLSGQVGTKEQEPAVSLQGFVCSCPTDVDQMTATTSRSYNL
ncbi:hypothetical protein J6590_029231 [Homalodisca vitripennis]|nr:hypothetical protein J6590_029231 [Homalodisca vitripennis]